MWRLGRRKWRTPDCRWTKLPKLDSFVSTTPKEVVRNNQRFPEDPKAMAQGSSVLATIVDKLDADKFGW